VRSPSPAPEVTTTEAVVTESVVVANAVATEAVVTESVVEVNAVPVEPTGIAEAAVAVDHRLLMVEQPLKNNSQQLQMELRQAQTDKVKCE